MYVDFGVDVTLNTGSGNLFLTPKMEEILTMFREGVIEVSDLCELLCRAGFKVVAMKEDSVTLKTEFKPVNDKLITSALEIQFSVTF